MMKKVKLALFLVMGASFKAMAMEDEAVVVPGRNWSAYLDAFERAGNGADETLENVYAVQEKPVYLKSETPEVLVPADILDHYPTRKPNGYSAQTIGAVKGIIRNINAELGDIQPLLKTPSKASREIKDCVGQCKDKVDTVNWHLVDGDMRKSLIRKRPEENKRAINSVIDELKKLKAEISLRVFHLKSKKAEQQAKEQLERTQKNYAEFIRMSRNPEGLDPKRAEKVYKAGSLFRNTPYLSTEGKRRAEEAQARVGEHLQSMTGYLPGATCTFAVPLEDDGSSRTRTTTIIEQFVPEETDDDYEYELFEF